MFDDKAKITKSILIDNNNWELIQDFQVSNLSKFINELINDALCDKVHAKRLLVKRLNVLQREAESLGLSFTFNIEKEK